MTRRWPTKIRLGSVIRFAFLMAATVTPYWAAIVVRVSPRATTWTRGVAARVGLGLIVAIGLLVVVGVGVPGERAGVGGGVAGAALTGDGLAAPEPAPTWRIQSPIAGLAR